MSGFLMLVIGLCAASMLGKLVWLASGKFPERRPAYEAVDVLINGALAAWGLVLLMEVL